MLSALKLALQGQDSADLSTEYEEFFLNNADDIAELLQKCLVKSASSACTHLQAQQLVCSMIQVHWLLVCLFVHWLLVSVFVGVCVWKE